MSGSGYTEMTELLDIKGSNFKSINKTPDGTVVIHAGIREFRIYPEIAELVKTVLTTEEPNAGYMTNVGYLQYKR